MRFVDMHWVRAGIGSQLGIFIVQNVGSEGKVTTIGRSRKRMM